MRTQASKTTGMRALAAMLALFLLLTSCLVLLPVPTMAEEGEKNDNSGGKIVTVVYDNSGSMLGGAENYAHYAIQMLMSLLNPNDQLYIIPMTVADVSVTPDNVTGKIEGEDVVHQVILSDSDRDAQLKAAMAKDWHEPRGGTPITSVEGALYYMENELNMPSPGEDSDTDSEYWLIVMTDGDFRDGYNNTVQVDPRPLLEESLSAYSGLHLVYLGMGDKALNLNKDSADCTDVLKDSAFFLPHFSADAKNLKADMVKIANEITGRYHHPAQVEGDDGSVIGTNFTVKDNTLVLDLDSFKYSIRKISILIQGIDATVTDVTYSKGACEASQICTIVSKNPDASGLKNGYSAVITADPIFNGGELTFAFENREQNSATNPITAENISILVEPALVLVPVLRYEQDNEFLPKPEKYASYSDADYINNRMSAGDRIIVGYEIHHEGDLDGAPVSLKDAFNGTVKEELSYAENSYAINTPFKLLEGTHTITLTVGDGDYQLYASIDCNVAKDWSSFRIEPTVTPSANDPSKVTVDYRVFYNNVQLTLSELQAYTLSLSSDTLKQLPALTTKNKNGTSDAVVECNVSLTEYGRFDLTLKAVKDKYSYRKEPAEINYYPEVLTVTPVGTPSLSMSANRLVTNTDAFTFSLSTEVGGNPAGLAFDNPVLQYSVTCDNPDVVLDVKVNGNVMTVTPTADKEKMDAFGQSAKTFAVTVKVWVPDMPSVTAATSDGTLELLPTQYSISAEADAAGVNRFNLPGNQSSVWFTLYKDGTPFTEEELQKALASGEFTVVRTSAPLSPVSHTLTVEEKDGGYAIRCQVVDGHFGPLTFFITSMFTPDDAIGFEASYRNADTTAADLSVTAANGMEYAWRIILLVIEIYLICLLISLSKRFTCYIPKGYAAYIEFKVSGETVDKISYCDISQYSRKNSLSVFPERLVPFKKVKQKSKIGDLDFVASDSSDAPWACTDIADKRFQISGETICDKLSRLEGVPDEDSITTSLRNESWNPNERKWTNQENPIDVVKGWGPGNPICSESSNKVILYFFKKL